MNRKLQQTFRLVLTLGLAAFFAISYSPIFAQNPTAKNVFGDRLLKSYTNVFVYTDRKESGETDKYDFYYNEKGQLVEVKGTYTDEYSGETYTDNYVFDYTPGTIDGFSYDVKVVNENEYCIYMGLYLKIGSNNYIESAYEKYKYRDGMEDAYFWSDITYNSDDQLENFWDGTFIYDNGNLAHVNASHGRGPELCYSTFIPNDDNIMLYDFVRDYWPEDDYWIHFAGLLGKPTKSLPTSNEWSNFTWSKSSDNMQTILVEDDGYSIDTHTFTWSSASTGISAVEKSETQTELKVYGADGRLRKSLQRGFNIIERGNGKYEKVMK